MRADRPGGVNATPATDPGPSNAPAPVDHRSQVLVSWAGCQEPNDCVSHMKDVRPTARIMKADVGIRQRGQGLVGSLHRHAAAFGPMDRDAARPRQDSAKMRYA
jgi:hypothetical protein